MLRPILHFFLIGAVLFAAKAIYEGRRIERPEVSVRVSVEATPAEVQGAIRDAILLHEAERYGWDKRDPIVFTHLVRNMHFIEPDSADDDLTLFERALAMDMQAHDPVVRSRLLFRAREALAYIPEDRMPTRADLEAHLHAHPGRFEREGRVRFQQVFLSGSKRGDSLQADATAMRARLSALGDGPPTGLGDPLPGLRPEQVATPSQIKADYGPDLAEVVVEALVGVWRGPVRSVYGLHFVRVTGKEPAYIPPLDVIAAEVRADRLREIRDELRKQRMAALVAGYTVHVVREP